jgi:hypothetical protein
LISLETASHVVENYLSKKEISNQLLIPIGEIDRTIWKIHFISSLNYLKQSLYGLSKSQIGDNLEKNRLDESISNGGILDEICEIGNGIALGVKFNEIV